MIFPVLSFVSMALFVGTPCFSFRKDRHLNAYCNVCSDKNQQLSVHAKKIDLPHALPAVKLAEEQEEYKAFWGQCRYEL